MSFNPEEFLTQNYSDANATAIVPIPVGEFPAMSEKIELREFQYKRGDKAGMNGLALDVHWLIQDESVREMIKRDPKIKQSMILDLGSDGQLLFGDGNNIGLGRLREALGQNKAGAPWNFQMLNGQVALLKIKQRMEGEDIYADVERVAPLS